MISINCPVADAIAEKFKDLEVDGIHFQTVKKNGLCVFVKTNQEDEHKAKNVASMIVKKMPEVGFRFSSVQIVDEKGNVK